MSDKEMLRQSSVIPFSRQNLRATKVSAPPNTTVGETLGCAGCPMRDLDPSNRFVPPQRPDDPSRDLNRLLIGEAPGEQEANLGLPFIGPCGKLLRKLLGDARVDPKGLTIINCIQCRPRDNKFPTDSKARKHIVRPMAKLYCSDPRRIVKEWPTLLRLSACLLSPSPFSWNVYMPP